MPASLPAYLLHSLAEGLQREPARRACSSTQQFPAWEVVPRKDLGVGKWIWGKSIYHGVVFNSDESHSLIIFHFFSAEPSVPRCPRGTSPDVPLLSSALEWKPLRAATLFRSLLYFLALNTHSRRWTKYVELINRTVSIFELLRHARPGWTCFASANSCHPPNSTGRWVLSLPCFTGGETEVEVYVDGQGHTLLEA